MLARFVPRAPREYIEYARPCRTFHENASFFHSKNAQNEISVQKLRNPIITKNLGKELVENFKIMSPFKINQDLIEGLKRFRFTGKSKILAGVLKYFTVGLI